jgi:hypothetical protein
MKNVVLMIFSIIMIAQAQSVSWTDFHDKEDTYAGKPIQLTGYFDSRIVSVSSKPNEDFLFLSPSIRSSLTNNDTTEMFFFPYGSLTQFTVKNNGDNEGGVFKATIKGLVKNPQYKGVIINSTIIEAIFLPYKSIEQYIPHPSWNTMMRKSSLEGSTVLIKARVGRINTYQDTRYEGGWGLLVNMADGSVLIQGDDINPSAQEYRGYEDGNNDRILKGDFVKIIGEFEGVTEHMAQKLPLIKANYIFFLKGAN